MVILNPTEALRFFEDHLPKFLSSDRAEVLKLISDLQSALENSQPEHLHTNVLDKGKALTKHILKASIELLSDRAGSARYNALEFIGNFIDQFASFEDLLFGLYPTYRDHTLHSLWVYLFGHQWIVNLGGYETIKISGQTHVAYLSNEKDVLFLLVPPLQKGSIEHMESMWAMISILHDVGYPVETISNEANQIFGRILDPFAIEFTNLFQVDMGSRIAILHQNISDLISTIYRPQAINGEEREAVEAYVEQVKARCRKDFDLPLAIYREPIMRKDEALEMEYKIAWVNKNHSAWSATFAFKNIPYLHESDYHGGGNIDYLRLLTRRDIIYSILHHTSLEPQDTAVNRFMFILLMIDDIEESVRFGRGGQARGLASDYCTVSWEFGPSKLMVELDYKGYQDKSEEKYQELFRKYRAQQSNKGDYVIGVLVKGETFNRTLSLRLSKDL